MKDIISEEEWRELKRLAIAYHTMRNRIIKRLFRRLDRLTQEEVKEFANKLDRKKYEIAVHPFGNHGTYRIAIFGFVASEANNRAEAFERSQRAKCGSEQLHAEGSAEE